MPGFGRGYLAEYARTSGGNANFRAMFIASYRLNDLCKHFQKSFSSFSHAPRERELPFTVVDQVVLLTTSRVGRVRHLQELYGDIKMH